MATTVAAYNLCPGHSERLVGVPCHRSRYAVKVCRPPAARLEFMVGFIERGIACGASVDTLVRHMLVIFTAKGRLGAFLSEDTELF